MKNILFFASVLAGFFLAASCQQESFEPEVSCNVVSYTIQVPGAIGTKAIGTDVAAVTELIYEVYRIDEQGTETKLYQKSEIRDAANGETNWTVELELVNNQDFRVLFWAQVPENGVYTTTSLKNVTLATGLNANAENYAAFAGQDEITYGENLAGRTVTLVRPVAQLNIATSAESLKLGEDVNGENAQTTVTFETTAVTVEGLSTVYNVAEGAAGADEATFTYAAKPVALSEPKLNVNGVDYTYVAMNYVGFAQPTGDNVTVTYTINTENVGTITNKISSVPVKANHRTNIIGNLITSTSDYTVTLSATWPTDEENVEVVAVSTAADLQDAINNISDGAEGNIKLEGDIDLGSLAGLISTKAAAPTYGLLIPAGKAVVLDLNGCTLKQEVECKNSYSMIQNNGTLTITGNGKVSFKDTGAGDSTFGWGSYTINNNGGALVVENGTIEHLGEQNTPGNVVHMYCAIFQYSGSTTINGGTISTPTYRSVRLWSGDMIINGGELNGQVWLQAVNNSANLTINGGTFAPRGGDGSSVFITNDKYIAKFAVNGGFFHTKIGCSDAAKDGVKGSIVGGIFTAAAKENTKAELLADGYFFEADGDNFKVTSNDVAKVGETTYKSLAAAIDAVEDGGTVTLIADEVFTEYNRVNNGGWWDGLAYSGDKSFTIDLGGYTIKQDGSLNDYLIWIKNDGAKANTITLKNGTMDAGTTAYSAFATASSNKQTITVNLENINLINNISNGAVVKARGGSVLNVKAGTVITGKDSYVGIEAVGNNTVVNVYEGAEIYQNGTTGDVGAIIGASYNATLNIYGGKGKSAKCGIIVMSTGATINVSGGEWTANGDGTVAGGNQGVLVSQNNRNESGWACKSILNVTGGTFKGGYDCWGMGPGQEPDDAQINIKGGNFNADPTAYLADGCKITMNADVYTVEFLPAAAVGTTNYNTLQEAVNAGGEITLLRDVKLTETVVVPAGLTLTLDLNGKTITSGFQSGSDSKHIYPIDNYGKLTIKDVAGNGSINGRGIYNRDAATLTIESVKVVGQDWNGGACVWSYGTGEVYLNNATFIGNTGCVSSEGYLEINGGTYTCYSGIDDDGVQKTSPTYNIRAYNGLKIIDGTFTSRHGVISVGGGEALLEAGDYTIKFNAATTSNVLYIYGTAQATIKGGNYISDNTSNKADSGTAILVSGTDASATVKGGTFVGMNGMVSGNVTLYGGTFNTVWNYNHYDKLSDKLAEGYEATQNADGSWTVAPSSTEN